jgi:hypothetical protein
VRFDIHPSIQSHLIYRAIQYDIRALLTSIYFVCMHDIRSPSVRSNSDPFFFAGIINCKLFRFCLFREPFSRVRPMWALCVLGSTTPVGNGAGDRPVTCKT